MFLIISRAFVKAYQDTRRKMSHAVYMKQNMSIVPASLSSLPDLDACLHLIGSATDEPMHLPHSISHERINGLFSCQSTCVSQFCMLAATSSQPS